MRKRHSGTADAVNAASLRKLDRLSRKIVRAWGSVLADMFAVRPDIRCEPAEHMPLGVLPECAWTCLYPTMDDGGPLQIGFSRQLLDRAVDHVLGGSGKGGGGGQNGLTMVELFMARRLAAVMLGTSAFDALLDPATVASPSEAATEGEDELIAGARILFDIALDANDLGQAWLILPVAENARHPAVAADPVRDGGQCHPLLAQSAAHICFEAKAVLMEPVVGIDRLLGLAVGDILPGSPLTNVPLLVEGRTVAVGSMGIQSGYRALKIETIDRGAAAQ